MLYGEMLYGEMLYGEMLYGKLLYGEMLYGEMLYGEMLYGEMLVSRRQKHTYFTLDHAHNYFLWILCKLSIQKFVLWLSSSNVAQWYPVQKF